MRKVFVIAAVLLCALPLALAGRVSRASQVAWYRFNPADNAARVARDTISNTVDGVFVGNSTVGSLDRPLISDNGVNIPNLGSVVIGNTANEGVAMTDIDFLFHSDGPAGTGNATLEFVAKTPAKEFASLFWTNTTFNSGTGTILGHPDSNRFNIQQTDFGSHGYNGDLKNSGAAPDFAGVGGFANNQWDAVAIVREHQGGNSYLWQWFINGNEVTSKSTSEPLPSNSNIWTIGSRGCCAANLVVDEVRFWDEALVHQDPRFLRVVAQQVPEPHSVVFIMSATFCLIVAMRGRK